MKLPPNQKLIKSVRGKSLALPVPALPKIKLSDFSPSSDSEVSDIKKSLLSFPVVSEPKEGPKLGDLVKPATTTESNASASTQVKAAPSAGSGEASGVPGGELIGGAQPVPSNRENNRKEIIIIKNANNRPAAERSPASRAAPLAKLVAPLNQGLKEAGLTVNNPKFSFAKDGRTLEKFSVEVIDASGSRFLVYVAQGNDGRVRLSLGKNGDSGQIIEQVDLESYAGEKMAQTIAARIKEQFSQDRPKKKN